MTKVNISVVEIGTNSKQVKRVDRETVNVNSPRAVTSTDKKFGTPASLITQVNQDDVERHKEMAKGMRGRSDEQKTNSQENASSEQSPKPTSSARTFSCWLCCGSCTKEDAQYTANPSENSLGDEDDNKIIISSDCTDDWEVDRKVLEQVEQDTLQVDPKEEQYAIGISESEKDWLLDPVSPEHKGRKCLVLDLDETLVHSSFEPFQCTFSLPIVLDGQQHPVYVRKRPFVDEFIAECAKFYELVIFTASMPEYANPVIDTLDKKGLIKHRLFRESCVLHRQQVYVKDLSRLGRSIKECIIIDNSEVSYLFDPTNAIGCTSWFGEKSDTELRDLLPVLKGPLLDITDVREMLDATTQTVHWLIDEFGEKSEESNNSYSITE